MYNKDYDLSELNAMRAGLIYDAISCLIHNVEKGVPYTAKQLAAMTGDRISTRTFEACLARGFHAVEKRKREEKKIPYRDNGKYLLFGIWNAECSIRREGVKVITIKEYDEQENLVNEYQKRRGRPYYTATF